MRGLVTLFVFASGLALAADFALVEAARAQGTVATREETEAREHYDRGVALFDESQFVAALAEFEAAYALTSRPALLFNIGQIHARLGHAVEATDALERYLAEMTDLAEDRRALVLGEIATQRSRIGLVRVEVRSGDELLAGASVSLDDVARGTTPLAEPLRASAGEHVLSVVAADHEASRERFRLAGGEERTLTLTLVSNETERGPIVVQTLAPQPPPGRAFPTMTVIGATLAGVGLVTWAGAGLATVLEADRLRQPMDRGGCAPSCTSAQTSSLELTSLIADVGLGVLVVGVVVTVIGAILELTGESESARPALSLDASGVGVTW